MIDKNPANIIRNSSVFSFLLLICIIFTYQTIIFIQTWSENSDANTINIAGRQRMLSQRISKNLLYSLSTDNLLTRHKFIELAEKDIKTLEANHARLSKNSTKNLLTNTHVIHNALKEIEIPLTIMSDSIKETVRLKNAKLYDLKRSTEMYFEYEQQFLFQMDKIVLLYEKGLERYVTQLNGLTWFGAISILVIMFINARFVVYKAIKTVELQFLTLKRKKEFEETILNSSREGIISMNDMGMITLMNARAKDLFCCSQNELLGKNIKILIPKFDINNIDLGKESFNEIELAGKTKDNKEFPILINLSTVESMDKKELVIFIKDLTLIKKKELELISIKKEVIDAVDANNAKSQFLSNMSHELRTPLNSIIGFSQLLETDTENPIDKEHLEYIEYIHDAGTHLLSLINEILDFAKLESGSISLSLETVNLSQIIKEVLILVYNLAMKKKIKIFSQAESLPDYYVIADKVRIKQVLLNLVSNAIKYNHDGGKIEVEIEQLNNTSLKVNVIDSGYGIPENKLVSLFEPFNRLGAENSQIEGTGIGLTITKNLIEEMKGKIGVISEEGKGSNFWIELPLVLDAKKEHKKVISYQDFKIDKKIDFYGKMQECEIVYIEDDYSNTALVKSFVNRIEGMTIYDAENAKIGLKMIAKIKPDLVLMDIDLPEINGFEALDVIRNTEHSNIPVVAISANAMKEDIENGLAAGFDGYITKPIEIHGFYETINQILINNQKTKGARKNQLPIM